MTTASKWRLLLLAFIYTIGLFLLQGCRQYNQQLDRTPVPTIPPNPTDNNSAANQGIAASTSPTPLPVPAAPTLVAVSTIPLLTTTPTPQNAGQMIIGYSVQNRPVMAYSIGTGEKKVAVIGGGESAKAWAIQYTNNLAAVPPGVTLWFVPDPNPDNANSSINVNGVNIFQNADSRFVNCSDQSASPETNGPYPFSEPESSAMRDILADSWAVVLLTAETGTLQAGGCGQNLPANTLANLLSTNTGESIETIRVRGHLADFLVEEGTAAAVISLERMDTAVIDTLLANLDVVAEATVVQGNFQWVAKDSGAE